MSGKEALALLIMMVWDIIKKTFRFFNPIRTINDLKHVEELYDLTEEVKMFANFIGKGPTYLEKYKMQNIFPPDYHIEFKFLSSEFSKQRRIYFSIQVGEKHVLHGDGGNSAASARYISKKNINYDEIANDMYRSIESSTLNKSKNYNPYSERAKWVKETINPILLKYKLSEDFKFVRRALIVILYEKNQSKNNWATNELLNNLGDKQTVNDFVKEIEGAYAAKAVVENI